MKGMIEDDYDEHEYAFPRPFPFLSLSNECSFDREENRESQVMNPGGKNDGDCICDSWNSEETLL